MNFIALTSRSVADAAEALAIHRFLIRLTQAMLAAFLWVFLFQYLALAFPLAQALLQIFLLYALTQTVAILAMPITMRLMRSGMRRSIVYGTMLLAVALAYVGLLLSGVFPHGVVAIGVLLGVQRALYRIPYTVEKTAIISGMRQPQLLGELILACTPVLVGILLTILGMSPFVMLFAFALLPVLALTPLMHVPNVYERFAWRYRETFGHLVRTENRRLLVSSVRQGALSAFLFLLWPLILMFALPTYLGLGAAFSMTLLIIFLFRSSRRRVRIEYRADGNAYLDEYTALKEMGIALGQLTVALLCAIALLIAVV